MLLSRFRRRLGQAVRLRLQAQGAKISVFENGEKLLEIEDADAPYLNRATQGMYPPGSTFKIVTLAAALESLTDVQQREFYCSGEMVVGDGTVTDNEGNGVVAEGQTLSDAEILAITWFCEGITVN